MRNFNRTLPVLCVFLICLIVRAYWISRKSAIDGDEHTSLILAYNAPGWADYTYENNRIYTADELRKNLLTDNVGGMKGYCEDIKALWNDNRDPSHASLYYMLLRTSLIGSDSPSVRAVIIRGCGLNLVLFALSFFLLSEILKRSIPGRHRLRALLLLLAYLAPITVSNTLLLREYQLAECLILAFGLFALTLHSKVSDGKDIISFKNLSVGSVLCALLVSAGYFNAFFAIMAGIVICHAAKRRRLPAICYLLLVAGFTMLIAAGLYKGFFNFFSDVRTAEVLDKAQGTSFTANLLASVKAGMKMLFYNVWGPAISVWAAAVVCVFFLKRKSIRLDGFRGKRLWLFAAACLWIAIVLFFSTWKMTRYIAPCAPLFSAFSIMIVLKMSSGILKKWIWLPFAMTIVYSLSGYRIEYLQQENAESVYWPENATRLFLYGPDNDERKTLTLLVPYLNDKQECIILDKVEDFHRFVHPSDSIVYVFANTEPQTYLTFPEFEQKLFFNHWQNIYVYRPD